MARNSSQTRNRRARRQSGLFSTHTGQVLGHWRLGERIGGGSFSDVYLARPFQSDEDTRCDYVAKILKQEHHVSPHVVETFRREAIAGRRVSHPHLVPVLSTCIKKPPFYIVMPRLSGVTLGQTVRHVGRLSVAHALWYARQVAEAIGELHRNEWRHGDVKPDNIMVAAGGHATLFDLGFASHPRVAPLTADQLLHGTLAYAAPELFTSRCSAGPASDVYSLGVSLYELITGNLPFNYAKSSRMAEAHLREIPPSPRTHLPQLPRSICQLLQRMLAKDRARRPYFQDELVCQLTRLEIEVLGLRVL